MVEEIENEVPKKHPDLPEPEGEPLVVEQRQRVSAS